MQKTLGWIMLFAGMFMLFVSIAFPMVTVVVDTTNPIIDSTVPSNGQTYSSLTYLTVYCHDSESGINSVSGYWDSQPTKYLTKTGTSGSSEVWQYGPFTAAEIGSLTVGSHTFNFLVTNNVFRQTSVSGSFTMYTALTGKWYVNEIEITSSTQTVYAATATVNFKFVKTAGTTDSSITCTVWEGTTKLLTLTNSATSTWTGSYIFSLGTHQLQLKASDGTTTITMAVIGMQIGPEGFELPQLNMLQMLGLASAGIGLVLILFGKPK
jgi:hypothetical protein